MSGQLLVFFAVIYRFLTTILGAIIGGIILILELHDWAKSSTTETNKNIAEEPLFQNRAALDTIIEKD